MYPRGHSLPRDGARPGLRSGAPHKVPQRVHQEEGSPVRLQDHQESARSYGDVPTCDQEFAD